MEHMNHDFYTEKKVKKQLQCVVWCYDHAILFGNQLNNLFDEIIFDFIRFYFIDSIVYPAMWLYGGLYPFEQQRHCFRR